jgi:anti-sigma regulatory factor (Ser/Thr protein kinase)
MENIALLDKIKAADSTYMDRSQVIQAYEMRITLKNDLSEIHRVADAVILFGGENSFPDESISDITLALEEIITNIISYAYEDKEEHQIHVQFALEGPVLVLEVQDDGIPFNPLEVSEVDINQPFEERQPGGLGLFFVRNLTDEMAYRREEDTNILTMKKKIW